jgi:CheY-like chemotaxis protein
MSKTSVEEIPETETTTTRTAEVEEDAAADGAAGAKQPAQQTGGPVALDAGGIYQAYVLLADDDPDMRQMIARRLRRAGYRVKEVADGGQLLKHLGNEKLRRLYEEPDLVISDIRMPGLSGLEVLGILRQADWAMPVILITAFGDRQTHDDARRLGAATLLDKPFELDDLMYAVRSILPPRF